MKAKDEEVRELLRLTETRISQLLTEVANLSRFSSELLEAQKQGAVELAELSEQLWALEDALNAEKQDKQRLLQLVGTFKARVGQIRQHAAQVLEAAASNPSRQLIAASLYDLAMTAEDDELARMTADYNARLAQRT